jgi:uncharacterized membrane protein YidH (DUF202 family)
MRLKSIFRTLFYIVLGGIAFWAPDIIVHALRAYEFSGRDVAVVSLLSLGMLLASYGLVYWSRGERRNAPSIAVPMLVGIWLFSSTAMMIGASYAGGGFAVTGIDTGSLSLACLRTIDLLQKSVS